MVKKYDWFFDNIESLSHKKVTIFRYPLEHKLL